MEATAPSLFYLSFHTSIIHSSLHLHHLYGLPPLSICVVVSHVISSSPNLYLYFPSFSFSLLPCFLYNPRLPIIPFLRCLTTLPHNILLRERQRAGRGCCLETVGDRKRRGCGSQAKWGVSMTTQVSQCHCVCFFFCLLKCELAGKHPDEDILQGLTHSRALRLTFANRIRIKISVRQWKCVCSSDWEGPVIKKHMVTTHKHTHTHTTWIWPWNDMK